MKVNNLFLAGAVALSLGMTACNNEDIPSMDKQAEGTTFAGMYISAMKDNATRAINDSQADYAGRDAESKLETLNLITTGMPQSWTFAASEGENKFWQTATPGTFKVSPWQTTDGRQSMALLFNNGDIAPDIATASTFMYGSAATAINDIKVLSTDDKFVMTSRVENKEIKKGIDKATVNTGTSEGQNVFSFDVERVVSQGLVAKAGDLREETADGKGKIDLDNITYAAVNGAAKTYLFRNKAGDRTITEADGLYKDFESAIDGYTEFENAKDPTGPVKDYLIRLGNLAPASENKINDDLENYKAISVAASIDAAKTGRGIYFLENSVNKDAFIISTNKDYGFYRLAYAKVYATYTPKEVWHLEEGKLVKKEGVEGVTFYRGELDGIIYASKAAAAKSELAPNQKAYTYTDGKCAYRALWNRQTDATGKTVLNADARRNNTYMLTVKAFQGIGMPWDSSDPNDPNLPKPIDPDEPKNPDNPDIEKEETFMRVEAKVLKWNLVSREVVLD